MTPPKTVLVVSVSILRDGKVLMIKENKPSVRDKWNFPSGRIEPGEDIPEAARREVKEETGYEVRLTAATGIYNFVSSMGDQDILFHFTGEIAGGSLQLEENIIVDSRWVSLPELLDWDPKEIREAGVIAQITNNLIAGIEYPMAVFHPQLPTCMRNVTSSFSEIR
ncbi:ADP-ribose pyrophosphatase YjhB, NUDIX family [Paenibacillus sophorae]|uniref:ADP-ribose pyrophosphatase YjhB, NUDIX family n=1 Tax=Paenibacillus sophorae TaxID=1333845 RepID=A0A1H8ST81_9BACL|nr:NUDIX domain-containing protein [Paenibacillus sophorae]QWU15555.1 NUDIX domain-containing protein [Paenibacillus sophorae]SEO81892.1 ADP-ribose pyrophosphatase YjhB, NUDIX family [Paenibacillus sophorae]